jgi:hypothetical protein
VLHARKAAETRGPTTRDLAVEVTAARGVGDDGVVLSWPRGPANVRHVVIRRRDDSGAFRELLTSDDGSLTRFEDRLSRGTAAEYWVHRDHNGPPFESEGHLYVGFDRPAVLDRGDIAVVIDRSIEAPLHTEITRLLDDLEGDGYRPIPILVARDDTVPSVKARILSLWSSTQHRLRTALLLGHVPVPYSGALAPDGHRGPVHGLVHFGAWPADLYYGELDADWTDSAIDTRRYHHQQAFSWIENLPGDGKFDQTTLYRPGMHEPHIPGEPTPRTDVEFDRPPVPNGEVELEVGRVDFADMPSFRPLSEVDLLRRYLDKNHRFRRGEIKLAHRGLVDDGFGYTMKEDGWAKFPFAAVAYRSYSAFFGPTAAQEGHLFAPHEGEPFAWAYAAGAGSFDSCEGVGQTSDFVAHGAQAGFLILYGSYYGDWNTSDNFWRASIASDGPTVAAIWNAPMWELQHMGLGAPIGTSTRHTQNVHTLVHLALMGDPTLHMLYAKPPKSLEARGHGAFIELTWPAVEGATGYVVLRGPLLSDSTTERRPLRVLTQQSVHETTFLDEAPSAEEPRYLVRAVTRQETASGTYDDASEAVSVVSDLNR